MNKTSIAVIGILLASAWVSVDRAAEGRALKRTPLDKVTIYEDSISRDTPIRIRPFGVEHADLGTGAKTDKPKYQMIAQQMKDNAPQFTLQGALLGLGEQGFTDVAELAEGEALPAGALVLEGEFTKLNPGSQGKRYWVGFGAGKSQVCAEGKLVGADARVWMEFEHCRHEAIGFFGGDSTGQMAQDAHRSGSHLAEFLAKWADGAYAR